MSVTIPKLDSFQILLDGFHEAIKSYPEIEKVRPELEELIQAATLDHELTDRQKDAIIARCKNYLKGEYGAQVKSQITLSDYNKSRQ